MVHGDEKSQAGYFHISLEGFKYPQVIHIENKRVCEDNFIIFLRLFRLKVLFKADIIKG